jgi:hypothetical protein
LFARCHERDPNGAGILRLQRKLRHGSKTRRAQSCQTYLNELIAALADSDQKSLTEKCKQYIQKPTLVDSARDVFLHSWRTSTVR